MLMFTNSYRSEYCNTTTTTTIATTTTTITTTITTTTTTTITTTIATVNYDRRCLTSVIRRELVYLTWYSIAVNKDRCISKSYKTYN